MDPARGRRRRIGFRLSAFGRTVEVCARALGPEQAREWHFSAPIGDTAPERGVHLDEEMEMAMAILSTASCAAAAALWLLFLAARAAARCAPVAPPLAASCADCAGRACAARAQRLDARRRPYGSQPPT